MKDEALRVNRADEPNYERREPTIGAVADAPPQEQAKAPAPRAENPPGGERRLARGYALDLAHGESLVDNVDVSASAGLDHLVLTDRRLIVYGRAHQTVYPLRAITRLAIVKYIRWWMAALGAVLAAAGAIGALMPPLLIPLGSAEFMYACGALFLIGLALIALGLLRPVAYIEITSLGGDMKLSVPRVNQALADFVNSLAQRIR